MNLNELQNMFGTEIARIYVFSSTVPENQEPVEYITLDFARAAGTNLIDAVVTEINNTWLVYTRNTTVDDSNFKLMVELPLPEPEVQQPPEVAESEPSGEPQPE